jgi:ribonuclease VapC
MTSVVIDASALLALWLGEPGSEHVKSHIDGAAMSAVNVDEVATKMLVRGDRLEQIAANLRSMPIEFVAFDYGQALVSASLKNHCFGKNISFADRACLALGLTLSRPVLTSDREWANLDIGISVELIR